MVLEVECFVVGLQKKNSEEGKKCTLLSKKTAEDTFDLKGAKEFSERRVQEQLDILGVLVQLDIYVGGKKT